MRNSLSKFITQAAVEDPKVRVLSGDHGYALFDEVRRARPAQFMNVGVAEQAMVGIAAGMCRTGLKPIVYGLAAFVPIRVLEQIKLDVCRSSLPVIFLGDGAGLVYSTLGASHQCAEDVACLRPLPAISIYAPADAFELDTVFRAARASAGPSYIRLGKSDRPAVHAVRPSTTDSLLIHDVASDTCIISMGSMTAVAKQMATDLKICAASVFQIKPTTPSLKKILSRFRVVLVLEEHSRYGGLFSTITELTADEAIRPRVRSLSLGEHFSERCGSYQHALSEHGIADAQLPGRVKELLGGASS